MSDQLPNPPHASRPGGLSWHHPKVRAWVYQALALAAVLAVATFLVMNTLHNLAARNIATGFAFLGHQAGFAIGESLIPYQPTDSYGRAILVGLVNTLRVSVAGIVLSTLLGTVLGIARLSRNWLVARLAAAYVELVRNVPLLLQLFFWYALVTQYAPGPRQALHPLPGVFLSNRGLNVPTLAGDGLDGVGLGLLLAIVLLLVGAHWWRKRLEGRQATDASGPSASRKAWLAAVGLLIGLPVLGWLATGAPLRLDTPVLQGFNFSGGLSLSPEFSALLAGLVIYTSAFTAEVVRAGIQAVDNGQWEAAQALGLRRPLALRLVVLPQALRVIIPPMTSQYLNLTKNSSLAVAIGYPDLVSVANTTLNQTGQAIEGVAIIMAAYLVVSLGIAMLMNLYNRRINVGER